LPGFGQIPTVPAVLVFVPTRTNTEDSPTTAEVVYRHDFLREHHGMAMRVSVDHHTDACGIGLEGETSEECAGFKTGPIHAVVEACEMIKQVERFEIQFFSEFPLIPHLLPGEVVLASDNAERDGM